MFIEEFQLKSLNFTTIEGQILQAKSIGTIAIPIANEFLLKLGNVIYTSNCNSNLISLAQLHDSNIIYINNFEVMILIQLGQLIAYARQNQNLFVLNLAISNKVI